MINQLCSNLSLSKSLTLPTSVLRRGLWYVCYRLITLNFRDKEGVFLPLTRDISTNRIEKPWPVILMGSKSEDHSSPGNTVGYYTTDGYGPHWDLI